MSDEKRRILEMLERGTITQEDAARLLDALGETLEDSSESTPSFQWEEDPDPGVTVGQAMEEARQAIRDAAQEAREAIDLAHQMGKEVARSVGEIFPKGENTSFSMDLDTPLSLEENAYPEPDILDPITEVRVEWVNGPIEIRRWDGNTTRVAEYAKRPLKGRERMETTLKNGVLRIRWTRETTFHGKLFLQKHLVVELPRELPELKQFRLETVSGEARICGIQAGVLRLNTVSGMLEGQNLKGAEIRAESVSGQVGLTGVSAQKLRVSSTSGQVSLDGIGAGELRGETVSGALEVKGNGENISLHTVSGSLRLEVGQYPKTAKLNTVSGDIATMLPEGDPGFTVEYGSMSGTLFSQFPLQGSLGKKNGRAVYGQGGAWLKLNTVSGQMELLHGEKQGS